MTTQANYTLELIKLAQRIEDVRESETELIKFNNEVLKPLYDTLVEYKETRIKRNDFSQVFIFGEYHEDFNVLHDTIDYIIQLSQIISSYMNEIHFSKHGFCVI